jgi:hypothetical protein
MGCVVNATPGRFTPEKDPVPHCIGGWVGPRAGLDGYGNLARTGIRSAELPAHSDLLYRLSYPGPFDICVFFQNLSRKFKFPTRIVGTLHADLCTFKIVYW